MIYRHASLVLDMDNSNKAKLYDNNKLMFIGDGYRAITMFVRASGDDPTVKGWFESQLKMREKPKFSHEQDLKQMKEAAIREMEQAQNRQKKRR